MVKPTVSICISAFNEEKNIRSLVMAYLGQLHPNFILKEIIVVADGCTDNTIGAINSLKDKKLKIIDGKSRKGLIPRVNQLLQSSRGDIIVLSDADIRLEANTVSKLIKPFAKFDVGMVGAKASPVIGNSLLQKGIAVSVKAYTDFAESYHHGKNLYTCKGVVALSRQLANKIKIPDYVYAQDAFLYLSCRQFGFKYEYVKTAQIWYYLPSTVSDHLKQNRRFESTYGNLRKHFGQLADSEYYRPPRIFLPRLIGAFFSQPLLSLYISILNIYCKLFARFNYHQITSRWDMITSTKK
ncbi:glycosyltransferase [Candidatus Amesbacteria bacterium]|nr:glycosyltransferase [Candidatus Amesbacteria bacterium]